MTEEIIPTKILLIIFIVVGIISGFIGGLIYQKNVDEVDNITNALNHNDTYISDYYKSAYTQCILQYSPNYTVIYLDGNIGDMMIPKTDKIIGV